MRLSVVAAALAAALVFEAEAVLARHTPQPAEAAGSKVRVLAAIDQHDRERRSQTLLAKHIPHAAEASAHHHEHAEATDHHHEHAEATDHHHEHVDGDRSLRADAGGGGTSGGKKLTETTWEAATPGLLLALFAGVATSFGAIALPFLPPGGPPPSAMAFAMCLAAGVMFTISAEMIWPALEYGGWWPIFLFSASAVLCLACCRLGDLIDGHHHHHHHGGGDNCEAKPSGAKGSEGQDRTSSEARSRRLALLLFFSLSAHNIPEGFAIAVSTISGSWFGLTVCIAVALHNIPEGLTLAVATYDWTKSRWKAVLVPTLAGLTQPLGAVLALSLFRDRITAQLIDDLLVSVAGVMFCIAIAELIPEAAATRCFQSSIAGLISGAAAMYIAHQVIDHASGEAGHGHAHSHGHHDFGFF